MVAVFTHIGTKAWESELLKMETALGSGQELT